MHSELPHLPRGGGYVDNLNYVSFGASNTNGYGLHGYLREPYYDFIGTSEQWADWNTNRWDAAAWDPGHMMDRSLCGYMRAPEGCYPDLIRDYFVSQGVNVKLDQFAMSSMRVEELRVLLDESYVGDSFTRWRFYDPAGGYLAYDMEGGVDVMREYVQNAVRDADLITYDMGTNNFAVYVSQRIMDGMFDNDFADIYGEEAAAKFYDMRAKLEASVIEMLGGALDGSTFVTVDDLVDTLAYALLGFCHNFDITMGIIRELNPDADIVVVSIQNMVSDMVATFDGLKLPIGEVLGIAIEMANTYMMTMSRYKDEYSYADVRQNGHVEFFYDDIVKYNGDPYSLDQSILDCFNCLDNDLHLQIEVTGALEQKGILPGSEEYEKALYAAYDAMAVIMSRAAQIDAIAIDELLGGGDIGATEDMLLDFIRTSYLAAANAAVETPDTPYDVNSEVDKLFESELVKAVANFGLRTLLGNSFYAHPNYNGHKQLFNAVMAALEDETTGSEAMTEAVFALRDKMINLGLTYGVETAKLLAEKIFDVFGLGDLVRGLAKLADTEQIVDYIIASANLDAPGRAEITYNIINLLEESSESKHLHDPYYVCAKVPGCTETGSCGYWKCSACGEMFRDFTCTVKIAGLAELELPAKGHTMLYIPAKAPGVLTVGNIAYYKCLSCGKLFSDVNGENEITAESVIVPAKLLKPIVGIIGLFR